ncbi:lipid-A-disaccharide synthase [Kaistia sp. 32K]|uniref:lipid-A-disaccharide synthase n=1 Tax=Kaistia sp. 32K TaxID=2795690 RepID=UPI0019158096|nr:lipid-A-disaccharide synthase [Kaistia sp. 32K]BCP53670.1 lipid-A-disaccharide synthase [Kaistia sp. 32K]
MSLPAVRPLDVFLIAGEESGDILGAGLMRSLDGQWSGALSFRGVGGHRMIDEGLRSLYPMDDLTAMGFGAVIAKLPTILKRMRQTVEAIVANPPDILVLVDAQDFNRRVAGRVRKRLPNLPIVKYVAPTVWAWRPGRARKMYGTIDHVLALLPFEPEVMRRLGGPATTYVGHPLLSEIPELQPSAADLAVRDGARPTVLVLPGSRRMELSRLSGPFGAALGLLSQRGQAFDLVLPTLPRLEAMVREATRDWPVQPVIVTGEEAKLAAFRRARVALAASGTVTLELALAGVPLVAGYRVSDWEAQLAKRFIVGRFATLPNIILEGPYVPELIQHDCTPEKLADALAPLIADGPARQAQLDGFARLDALMSTGGVRPSERAAATVLAVLAQARAAG